MKINLRDVLMRQMVARGGKALLSELDDQIESIRQTQEQIRKMLGKISGLSGFRRRRGVPIGQIAKRFRKQEAKHSKPKRLSPGRSRQAAHMRRLWKDPEWRRKAGWGEK